MRRLYIVRHAEPAEMGIFLGRRDPPLSDFGRAHAREHLAGLQGAIIYSSPLRRAVETAALIENDCPRRVLADLAEISFGEWEGRSWREVERDQPEVAARKMADWRGTTPPGGEDWESFSRRIAGVLEIIRAGPFPAIVVAHATVNSKLVELITGQDALSVVQAYGEVFEYVF